MANGNRSAVLEFVPPRARRLNAVRNVPGIGQVLALLLAFFLALGGPGRAWAFGIGARTGAPQAVTWSGFTPTGWVTATPFSSSVTA